MAGRNTDPFKPIGRRLAALRTERKLTQRALAEILGRPHSYVDRVELAERRLDVLDLQAFALAFDMAPTDLLELLLEATKAADA